MLPVVTPCAHADDEHQTNRANILAIVSDAFFTSDLLLAVVSYKPPNDLLEIKKVAARMN
jgi:hypothetical protein